MQQMANRPEAIGEEERSRRRPPRRRSPSPIPIPESPPEAPARRTMRLQDVLEAQQRAMDARIEAGLKELHRAAAETLRAVATEAARSQRPAASGAATDTLRGAVAHAEERFQNITVRLQRMEGALRQMARAQRESATSSDPQIAQGIARVEMLARAVADMGAEQREALARLAADQAKGLARIRAEQRTLIREMLRRTGLGVVAVARRLREEIAEEIRAAIEEGTSGVEGDWGPDAKPQEQLNGKGDPEPPEEEPPPAALLDPWADPRPASRS
jgi:small-conductance mechanosensitive channel